jgi:glycosyltransferase involved in cell wall biosynthesis
MVKLLGKKFVFVSTEPLPAERKDSGYEDCSGYSYNINSFESEKSLKRALQLGMESDVVIFGDAPEIFIIERINSDKCTFKYSERVFKDGKWRLLDPREIIGLWRNHIRYRNRNVYMLPTGKFAANDFKSILAYPGKQYKWGYFTEVVESDIDDIIRNKPEKKAEIIWTGRFLSWKHPELAVKLAHILKTKGYEFQLRMVGAGELEGKIRRMIRKLDLSDRISLEGSMPNSSVRQMMKASNIFLFTSDRKEGWGVVLNEAMNYGCAVIASDQTGGSTYLIRHGFNGLIFKSGNLKDLIAQTENLITDASLRRTLGKNAYLTLINEWNPEIAAGNFLKLADSVLSGTKILVTGPCSRIS